MPSAVAKSEEDVATIASHTAIFVAAIEALLGHRLNGALYL